MRSVFWWGIGLGLSLAVLMMWQWPDDNMHVIACDVGQGDAFLIVHGFDQVLIDGGDPRGGVGDCLGRYLPFWDRKLEMVVATHADSDHAGGLSEVIRDYRVGVVVMSEHAKDTGSYRTFLQAVEDSGARVHLAEAGQELQLGSMQWMVMWPPKAYQSRDSNEVSVVLQLQYNTFYAWFTGDVPAKVEKILVERGVVRPAAYLKVSHHGSAGSTSATFLEKIQPNIAVMGVGADNRYGHPSAVVLQRLNAVGARVWRTDIDGEGVVVSDGNRWWTSKVLFSRTLW